MSTNAQISKVAYIGWGGITGCEVLDLHKELTGLIGGTGAGKSTLVMCLDYAILPDRRSLEIKPISQLKDTHKAGSDLLVGRINPAYGYAYTILDIAGRDGKRLIAGIYVEPVDGRAHFTPWLIRNVPPDTLLQDLLSVPEGGEEYYPAFPELKRHLASMGVDATTCRSVGEYGQALYEAGIIPSSMTSTGDRALYAKLLETTFKGGITDEVSTNLKSYLLPPQSQVQELVQGLQECTNDVLKTRSAVAAAKQELTILKSTYGVGKDAVLTALRCIGDDIKQAEETIQRVQSSIANKRISLSEQEKSIPFIEQQIQVTEQSKKTKLANSLLELKQLGEKKATLWQAMGERERESKATALRLKQFNAGSTIWRKVAGQFEREDYDQIKVRIDCTIREIAREIFAFDLQVRNLQEEDLRLSSEQSSSASERLAEILGGQSLEQALGHVSEKESVALEMTLGGLTDGVVGVGLDELSKIRPSEEIPEMFWLGHKAPSTKPIREAGDWYVAAAAEGYIVASKARASVFGSEARKTRRHSIAKEISVLALKRSNKSLEEERIKGHQELLLENNEIIQIYLQNRQNPLAIDKAAQANKKAFEQSITDYSVADTAHRELEEKIVEIEEPFDRSIKTLGLELADKQIKIPLLRRDIEDAEISIKAATGQLESCRNEQDGARAILGSDYGRFSEETANIEFTTNNIFGLQAKRVAELSAALGSETILRFKSFAAVDSQDRLSVVRIWPDLMSVVRETISIELSDRDGEDLIEAMQKMRANLDSDLARQEDEVRINARNIYLNINSTVRNHKTKIDKLSRLGQNMRFGNVSGIRIQLTLRTQMLTLLEQFAAQLSLFNKEKPVDQVLKEFFESASDGLIKMDGENLLDYRNYVDLVIEAKRMVGNWEPAADLSGGESIGCGVAIALMLTRSIASRAESGVDGIKADQIRPLFAVDEANRLDAPGLKMLVEFAKRECFQLIVTAPVLKPDFDCTLYALSRVFTPDEKLLIRGVRVKNIVELPVAA